MPYKDSLAATPAHQTCIDLEHRHCLQVVRRRAVPREVGAPPGGPALVHTQIPVIFFTEAGVPGEVTEALPGPQDNVTASMQAPSSAGCTFCCLCCRSCSFLSALGSTPAYCMPSKRTAFGLSNVAHSYTLYAEHCLCTLYNCSVALCWLEFVSSKSGSVL